MQTRAKTAQLLSSMRVAPFSWRLAGSVCMILLGCCANVICLELMVRYEGVLVLHTLNLALCCALLVRESWILLTFVLLRSKVPACGNLVTSAQFMFIALEVRVSMGSLLECRSFDQILLQGAVAHVDGFTLKARSIPILYYFYQVALFWIASVINNKVHSRFVRLLLGRPGVALCLLLK
jgi:hypothetical protein